jgi:hypothetical protein
MRKVLKYLALAVSVLILIALPFIFAIYIRYQSTVRTETGKLKVAVKPGKLGKWVNPFIGTGGFPSYTSGDDIPGPNRNRQKLRRIWLHNYSGTWKVWGLRCRNPGYSSLRTSQ